MNNFFKSAVFFGFGLIFYWGWEAAAFPPAPYYTVYGSVRDEHGQLLQANGAVVVFYYQSQEHSRYTITNLGEKDYNYEIRMKLDMNRGGTSVYDSLAVNAGLAYTLAIDIGGVLYYPIEISTPPTIGSPADRHRLDLTLGEDTDNDGLPDAWERSQLYYAGLPTTDISSINHTGDLDQDGVSDYQEYLAGTYATDSTDLFYLKIVDLTEQDAVVEFYGITSKTYSIEKSSDMLSWTTTNFAIEQEGVKGELVSSYIATDSGIVRAYIPTTTTTPKVFYRVKIQ